MHRSGSIRAIACATAAIAFLAPALLGTVRAGGYATTDVAETPRLLGGEVLFYQFDVDDRHLPLAGQVRDLSGRGGHGTLVNAQFGGGRFDGGLDVAAGRNSFSPPTHLRVNDLAGLRSLAGKDFSVAFWVYPRAHPMHHVFRGDSLDIYHDSQNFGGFRVCKTGASGAGACSYMGGAFTYNAWQHYAIISLGGSMLLFKNGGLVSSVAAPAGLSGAFSQALVGSDPWAAQYYPTFLIGVLDEFRVYDRALSVAEVQSVMSLPYWHPNTAPVARIAQVPPAECADGRADVPLDATASTDVDGDALRYAWTPASAMSDATSATPTGRFPLGTTGIGVTVNDSQYAHSATSVVRVVDTIAPRTTASLAGSPGEAGWWRSDVDVTLSAVEACGLVETLHRVDAGPTSASARFAIAGDGAHDLRWASRDVGGNVEAERSATVRIDATAPSVAFAEPRPGHAYVNDLHVGGVTGLPTVLIGESTIRVDALDATSGVARVEFRIDGALRHVDATPRYSFTWDAGAEPLGAHTIEVRAVDAAGNAATASLDVLTAPLTPEAAIASVPSRPE